MNNLRYKINSMVITSPEDIKWLNEKENEMITLITCYPFNYMGDAPLRYIVTAKKI